MVGLKASKMPRNICASLDDYDYMTFKGQIIRYKKADSDISMREYHIWYSISNEDIWK